MYMSKSKFPLLRIAFVSLAAMSKMSINTLSMKSAQPLSEWCGEFSRTRRPHNCIETIHKTSTLS